MIEYRLGLILLLLHVSNANDIVSKDISIAPQEWWAGPPFVCSISKDFCNRPEKTSYQINMNFKTSPTDHLVSFLVVGTSEERDTLYSNAFASPLTTIHELSVVRQSGVRKYTAYSTDSGTLYYVFRNEHSTNTTNVTCTTDLCCGFYSCGITANSSSPFSIRLTTSITIATFIVFLTRLLSESLSFI